MELLVQTSNCLLYTSIITGIIVNNDNFFIGTNLINQRNQAFIQVKRSVECAHYNRKNHKSLSFSTLSQVLIKFLFPFLISNS